MSSHTTRVASQRETKAGGAPQAAPPSTAPSGLTQAEIRQIVLDILG